MSKTDFQPIFDYIDESSSQLKEELLGKMSGLATKDDINGLQKSVDAFAKESRDRQIEGAAKTAKVDRIEKWVIVATDKTKIPYKP